MPAEGSAAEITARLGRQLNSESDVGLSSSKHVRASNDEEAEFCAPPHAVVAVVPEATDSNMLDTSSTTSRAKDIKPAASEAASESKAADVTATAVARVLSTVELAEEILCHLDAEDLLCVRCVSMKLHNLILSSPQLRRALFLDPGSHADVHQDDRRPITQLIDRAYTRDAWMQKLVADPSAYLSKFLLGDFDPSKVMFNPFFVQDCINDSSPLKQRQLPQITTSFLNTNPDFFFRKMYITQPPLPIKTATIDVDSRACATHGKDRMLEENFDLDWKPTHEALGKGMKLGELIDVLHLRVRSICPYSKARVDSLSGFGLTIELADAEEDHEPEQGSLKTQENERPPGETEGVATEEAVEDAKPICVPRGPDDSPVEAGYAIALAMDDEGESEESEDETNRL
ncbi:hypothetical protein AC579_2443 [Pseudocercospora musae]|uniref:F-box domain-containing protein n=1 Tax=Pseudocercospora musae TaxID=113226 RepID=A0A139HZ29_9PEZI|nr:hypothetical protein AC579_2443 [Pseudocercospora musae]